ERVLREGRAHRQRRLQRAGDPRGAALRRADERSGRRHDARVLDGRRLHGAELHHPAQLHARGGELPRRSDPASAVLSVRHELRQDDADHEERAPAAARRAVQRAESGDLRRAAIREQSDERAVRLDRSQRRTTVELSSVRTAGTEAAVLRRAAPALARRSAMSAKAAAALLVASLGLSAAAGDRSRRIEHGDLPEPLQRALAARGSGATGFSRYVERVHADSDRRVAEGEREHLIYFALQSRAFTGRPRIEPALSARRFVERLSEAERKRLLDDSSYVPAAGWP